MENKEIKTPIVEIFESIQGEGKSLGLPSIFIRFWGCSLRCTFQSETCDTPYAVFNKELNSKMMTTTDIIIKIMKYKSTNIIFTGGEPLIHQKFINKLIFDIKSTIPRFYKFEVETNGTIAPESQTLQQIDFFNISIKLKSSNQINRGYDKLRYNKDTINKFPINKSAFKFVITNQKDMCEIFKITKAHKDIKVYLMPQGTTRNEILNHNKEVVDMCIKNQWIYSPREHIMIWNTEKGV